MMHHISYSVDVDSQKPMSAAQKKQRMKRMEEIRYSHDEGLYNLQEEYPETDPDDDYDTYERRRDRDDYDVDYRSSQRGSYYDDYHYQDDYRSRKSSTMPNRREKREILPPPSPRYVERQQSYDRKRVVDDESYGGKPQKVIKAKLKLQNIVTNEQQQSPTSKTILSKSSSSHTKSSLLNNPSTSSSSKQSELSISPRILEEIEYDEMQDEMEEAAQQNVKKNSTENFTHNSDENCSKTTTTAESAPETPTTKKSFKMHLTNVTNKKLFKVPEINQQFTKLSNLFTTNKLLATRASKRNNDDSEKCEKSQNSSSGKEQKNKKQPQDVKQNSSSKVSTSQNSTKDEAVNAAQQQTQGEKKEKEKDKSHQQTTSTSTNSEKKSSQNQNENAFEVNKCEM